MKKEEKIVEVHIAVGLPGSGKTTWMKAESERVKYTNGYSQWSPSTSHESWYIDMDKMMGEEDNRKKVCKHGFLDMERLLSYCACLGSSYMLKDPIYVWIDGLALNIDDVLLYVRGLSDLLDPPKRMYIGGSMPFKWNIVVDQWRCNREQCLINDKLRLGTRKLPCTITIQNADYSLIREEDLLKTVLDEGLHINGIKVVYHDVPVAEDWQIVLDRHGDPERARYLHSRRWCLGGTWANYLGSSGTIDSEEPLENTPLDNLLEEICPDIKYLQYKKLKSICVTLEERRDSDPYGGSATYVSWVTDLKKLYETLTSWGYSINNAKKKKN